MCVYQKRHHRRHRHGSKTDGSGADAGSGTPGTPTGEVYVSKFQRRKTKVSELGDLNYGFEFFADNNLEAQSDTPPTVRRKKNSVYHRKSIRERLLADDEQSERQSDTTSEYSDLDRPEMTSSAMAGNPTPGTQSVARGEEVTGVKSLDEIPETENKEAAAENTEEGLNPDDVSNEEGKADSSGGDTGQEAVPGGEAEPGEENKLADEESEEDPFAQLPVMAPYQEPPEFKGHSNYGFEIHWKTSDLDRSEMTSSAMAENPPPGNQSVAREEEVTGVESPDEIPETENKEAETENTEDVLNPDDVSNEERNADSSGGDTGQEAVPGGEVEPGEENELADEESEEDPFAQLPLMAPYQDPPVFMGQNNYGFEISWMEPEEQPEEQTADNDESQTDEEDAED